MIPLGLAGSHQDSWMLVDWVERTFTLRGVDGARAINTVTMLMAA